MARLLFILNVFSLLAKSKGLLLSSQLLYFANIVIFIQVQKQAATSVVLWKKVFLEISQNSQENIFTRVSFLIKL